MFVDKADFESDGVKLGSPLLTNLHLASVVHLAVELRALGEKDSVSTSPHQQFILQMSPGQLAPTPASLNMMAGP